MGRHRTDEEKVQLREQALALRAQGVRQADILRQLGIGSDLLHSLVAGAPLPDSLARPQAKDEVRAIAVGLREQGWTYNAIVRELGVSKSSCSLWLRDVPAGEAAPTPPVPDVPIAPTGSRAEAAREMRRRGMLLQEIATALDAAVTSAWRWTKDLPVPDRARHGRSAEDCRAMNRERWDRVLAERQAEREAVVAEASTMWGTITGRDLILGLVISYWCEGAKSKPWQPTERLQWMNSDPRLVRLFLEGLTWCGVKPEQLVFRLHIHETADELSCRQWWADVVGVDAETFRSSTIKRHKPKTRRQNRLDGYRGCLCISVLKSRDFYQLMDGLFQALGTSERMTPAPWPDAIS